MTKTYSKLATLSATACIAGATMPLSADDSHNAMSVPASEFAPMQRYAVTYDRPKDVAEFYVRTLGLPPRTAVYEQGGDPRNTRHKVVIATVERIADPQVRAIQWRLELKAEGDSWATVAAGLRRKCQNGPNTSSWTRELCP